MTQSNEWLFGLLPILLDGRSVDGTFGLSLEDETFSAFSHDSVDTGPFCLTVFQKRQKLPTGDRVQLNPHRTLNFITVYWSPFDLCFDRKKHGLGVLGDAK